MGGGISQGQMTFFWENLAAHCEVVGHSTESTVRCAKRLNLSKCRFGSGLGWAEGTIIRRGCRFPQGKAAIFWGCPDHSKALAILAAASRSRLLHAKRIIQSFATEGIIHYAKHTQIVF